jgi:hypothetical protein
VNVFGQEKAHQMKPASTNPDPHAQARLRLLDLAEDASLYLRRSAEPTVRVAAALLLAASLAACSAEPSSSSSATDDPPAVTPLAQEVREGLPTTPGTYAVAPNGLTRDAQGVYGFSWRTNDGATTWNQARSSLVMLAQGTADTLEMPASGDPILRLKPDTAITMPDDDGVSPTPTPGTSTASTSSSRSSYGGPSILWYPFFSGGGGGTTIINNSGSGAGGAAGATDTVGATTPAYRNPPAAEPGQGSVRGASSSLAAPTSSARTWTSPSRSAATGQAGGPGRGTAASARSGASDGGTASGAARPSSSSFSGGRSGTSSSASSSSGG